MAKYVFGAGGRTCTCNLCLGKAALCFLSYARECSQREEHMTMTSIRPATMARRVLKSTNSW